MVCIGAEGVGVAIVGVVVVAAGEAVADVVV
jgi:hypothetical protein